jgi:WD40 repeat protein
MWDVALQVRRHAHSVNAVSVSNDEAIIATASDDKKVGLYNFRTKRQLLLSGHTEPVSDIRFCPTADLLVSASHDGSCIFWDSRLAGKLRTIDAHSKPILTFAWSPDGNYIVTGSQDRSAAIWSATDFTRVQLLTGLRGWVRDVAWQENLIAVGGNDKVVLLYDTRTGKVAQSLPVEGHSSMTALSWHRSGGILAGVGFDRSFRLWDLRIVKVVRTQEVHGDVVNDIRFHHTTDDFLTVGSDGIARIWNLKSHDVIASFRQHEGPIRGCCWYPRSQGFVTVGTDRKVCCFDYIAEDENPWYDGGDMLAALERTQETLANLTLLMKKLDDRLMLQEERVRWLKENDAPIARAFRET